MSSLQYVLTFDGTDDYMSVPDRPSLQVLSYTVEVWIKPNGKPSEEWKGIVGKPGRNYHIWIHNTGYIHHRFRTNKSTNAGAPNTPNGSLKWDQWNHVAITNDGTTAKTYINGDLQAEGPTGGTLIADKTPLYVARALDEAVGRYFKGQMAEMRIWNQVRSPEEIKRFMGQRLNGNEPGLAAYWPLNEGNGTTAGDRTSNGNQGTIYGATWTQENLDFIAPGATDLKPQNTQSIASFNGINNYIEVPYKKELNPAQFTLSCWVKVEGGLGQWRSPVTCRTAQGSTALGGYILYAGNNNKWQFWTGNGGWVGVHGADVVLNTWTHVAATYDGSTMKLYINGELSGKPVPSKILINTQYPLRIGAGVTESNPGVFFNGKITEVRLWDRARSQEEIQQSMHYRLRGDEEGLVAYWPLNQESGTSAEDKTGKGNPGTLQGATWATSSLELSPAPTLEPAPAEPSETSSTQTTILTFDGVDDYVEIPTNPTLDVIDNFTIEAWIKPEVLSRRIIDKNFGGQSEGFTFDTYPQNLRFINKGIILTSRGTLKTGTWQHVAVTFKQEANGAKLYINGELDQTGTPSQVGTVTKLPVRLGSQADALGYLFKGEMAEVRIWNRVRSPEEIKASMNQRLAGDEEGLTGYWPLNEGTGTTAEDMTSNTNPGRVHGGTWGSSDLRLTLAEEVSSTSELEESEPSEERLSISSDLMFDGVDDSVEVPTSEWEAPTFSVEMWAKASQKQSNYAGVMSTSHNPSESGSFQIDAMGGYYRFCHTDIQVRIGKVNQEWQHLAVTYDGSTVKTYLNGEEQYAKAIDSMPTIFRNYRLGRNRNGDKYFAGELSDVRVWNRALTAEEIQAKMDSRLAGNEAGLVAYWLFDEGTGEQVPDKTGNSQPGTIDGATWQQDAVEMKPAIGEPVPMEPAAPKAEGNGRSVLSFNGETDYIETDCKLNFGTEPFTLEAWVYNTGKSGTILSSQRQGVSAYQFRLVQEKNAIAFMLSDRTGNDLLWDSQQGYLLQSTVAENKWSHIAVKRIGTTHQLYVDGKLASEWETDRVIDWQNSTVPLRIGAQCPYSGDGGIFYFQGKVAEVRIWNRERSIEEIQTQKNSELSGQESGLLGYWPLNEGDAQMSDNAPYRWRDRTGNSTATLYGGTWEQQDSYFLEVPLVDETQSPSGAIVPATSANVIPKADQPEDLNLDLDFDKSVMSITILTDTNHVGGKPKTIYGKEQKKKRKKRKKQNKYLSPLEKLVRDVAKRQDKATRTYVERHERSNRKKKNGWIKDFVKNTAKSWEQLF